MLGLSDLWSKLRSFISGTDEAPADGYVPILVEGPKLPEQRARAARNWTATAADKEESFRIGCEAVRRFKELPPIWTSASMNEATTRSAVLDPLLETMGWRPWRCEVPLEGAGRVDYYVDAYKVAIEAKAANPLFDDLDARATHPRQVLRYLGSDDVTSVIFTNARFWWRFERDPGSARLFALRFDLNRAQTMLKARGQYEPLAHFASFFQAAAFRPGANLTLAVHPGRAKDYGPPVGTIMIKDINQGLGRSSLDE